MKNRCEEQFESLKPMGRLGVTDEATTVRQIDVQFKGIRWDSNIFQ